MVYKVIQNGLGMKPGPGPAGRVGLPFIPSFLLLNEKTPRNPKFQIVNPHSRRPPLLLLYKLCSSSRTNSTKKKAIIFNPKRKSKQYMETGMISVDRWSEGSQAYFLTHLHADHTSGLTPTWKWGPLFCSRLTAKLFPMKFPGFKLSLLKILDLGNWYSLSLVSPSSGLPTAVQVMAIDANHCPGNNLLRT